MDEEVHSRMKWLGMSEHDEYKKYKVEHETLRDIRARFQGEIYNSIIHVVTFDLFASTDFSHLYAATREPYCNEFLHRLKSVSDGFAYLDREIDMRALRENLHEDVRGAWFRELEIADVNSAALWGPTVTDSDDWARYEALGNISTLSIELDFAVRRETIQVTRSGGIVLYGNMDEGEALEFVQKIDRLVQAHELRTDDPRQPVLPPK
jgi:hypothetical protein